MEPRSRRRRVDDFRASPVARSEDEGVSPSVLLGYLLYLENRSGGDQALSDIGWKILCTEENWFARGVKEAIAIRKIRPTLNADAGRFHLSPMYDKLIQSSLVLKTPSHGNDDATVHQQGS